MGKLSRAKSTGEYPVTAPIFFDVPVEKSEVNISFVLVIEYTILPSSKNATAGE